MRSCAQARARVVEHDDGPELPEVRGLPLLVAPDRAHLGVVEARVGPGASRAGAVRDHDPAEPAVRGFVALEDPAHRPGSRGRRGGRRPRGAWCGGALPRRPGRPARGRALRDCRSFMRATGDARPRAGRGRRSYAGAAAGSTRGAPGSPAPPGTRATALRLPLVGHDAEDLVRLEDLADRHRDRLRPERPRDAANQPSPSCCRRQASSRSTTRYGSSVVKSAGGSLKARWPFSPMPTKATSTGWRAEELPHPSRLRPRIGRVARDEVEGPRVHLGGQPLLQVAAEARGMRLRQADVLVQVEEDDPAPVDPFARPPATRGTRTARPPWPRSRWHGPSPPSLPGSPPPRGPRPRAAISALVSKTRISISVPQRRRPRAHEQLQPLLRHQSMVRLLHVDVVEAEEVLPRRRGAAPPPRS